MNNTRRKLVLGENVWTGNCQKYIMKLYWLKERPSDLVLVPFQPSKQLSHVKVGCSRYSNIRKVSMISARHNSKRTELSQILKHVSHSAISSETVASIWAMLVNIPMEYVLEFDDWK